MTGRDNGRHDGARVLLITDRAPGIDSGYGMRVANVIDGLARTGELRVCLIDSSKLGVTLDGAGRYDATVIRAADPSRLRKTLDFLRVLPRGVRYLDSTRLRARIEESVGNQSWDVIWCSRARVHVVSRSVPSTVRIVDFDDLGDQLRLTEILDRGGRYGWLRTAHLNLFGLLDAMRWNVLQRMISNRVDRVVVCSAIDANRFPNSHAAVIQNGYPLPVEARAPKRANSPELLFVGPLTYEPNRLAVEWLVAEVMPLIRERALPQCELVVVGDDRGVKMTRPDAPGVSFAGWVRDVGPYYERASVAVTPLHSGGGTRLKVIEALARCVPLVSTSFGCQGFDLVEGTEVLVADDPQAFAQACIDVIADDDLRARLVSAGRARYDAELTSETTSHNVHQLVDMILQQQRVGAAGRT